MAHNMASILYLHTKLYSSAEWHARRALELGTKKSEKGHESRGAYNRVMAQILACRYEFDEAARFGQAAITEYSFWHTPTDDFLAALIVEVEAMKNRTWTAPK
jgi:ATP/maltotriose-dependent transcriptional regulator MalT